MRIGEEFEIRKVGNGFILKYGELEEYDHQLYDRKGNKLGTEKRDRTIDHEEVFIDVKIMTKRIEKLTA